MREFNNFLKSSYAESVRKISPIILGYIVFIMPFTTSYVTKTSNFYLSAINFILSLFICMSYIIYAIKKYRIYISKLDKWVANILD